MLLTGNESPKIETCKIGSVDELRQILASQEMREVATEEAEEIGNALIDFYQLLSEEDAEDDN